MNTPILYFAYGSNLNSKRIHHRCPTAATFRAAKLRNYRLVERLYADIDYEEGAVVYGVLYCISERELDVLDTYEGCPRIYRRIWIEAECNGETSAFSLHFRHFPLVFLHEVWYNKVVIPQKIPSATP